MAEENENLIKNVDLNGSLISHQNLEELGGERNSEEEGNPSKWDWLTLLSLEIFNFVKEFDQVNEMRPLFTNNHP